MLGPTRRTAASTSSTSELSHLLVVVDRASASVNAIIFLFALSFLARLLRCCAQELLRIVIFVSVLVNALIALSMLLSMLSCNQCSCCIGNALVDVWLLHVVTRCIVDALVLVFVA